MQVTVQKLSPVLVEFDIEVGAERVNTELAKAYGQIARSARVPGFRPGRAPRKVLSHYFGSRVQADVVKKLVDETFAKAVSDHKVQPVTQPAIEPQKLVENTAFSYKARVEVLPTIESVEYEGLEAERPKVEVDDAATDKELESLRTAHATLEAPKSPRASAKGDALTIDFTVIVGEKAIEDAGTTGLTLELGSGQFLPEIETALYGKSVGERVAVEVRMPAQHPHKELRGKAAQFSIEIKELKERVLPELDDEFAKDVGDFESLAALRADLGQKLEKREKEASDNRLAELLVAALVKKNPIPVPETLVVQQMRLTEQEILSRARSYGQQASGLGEDLRAQIREDSEVKVRAGLLMAEIAKKEAIKIGNDEIEEGLKELAEQSGKNIAKVRAEYREPKKRDMLVGMILENKVLDILEAKAKISNG